MDNRKGLVVWRVDDAGVAVDVERVVVVSSVAVRRASWLAAVSVCRTSEAKLSTSDRRCLGVVPPEMGVLTLLLDVDVGVAWDAKDEDWSSSWRRMLDSQSWANRSEGIFCISGHARWGNSNPWTGEMAWAAWGGAETTLPDLGWSSVWDPAVVEALVR